MTLKITRRQIGGLAAGALVAGSMRTVLLT
jgi:hypothetical protein